MNGHSTICILALMAVSLFPVWSLSPAYSYAEERRAVRNQDQLDEQLVSLAIKLYDLDVSVPTLYARAFKKDHAGEGLFAELFNDPITVLRLALEQNERNMLAHLYLGKSYLAKSWQGEGNWSEELVRKAQEHFSIVVARGPGLKSPSKIVLEAKKQLDKARQILAGMGVTQ
jgi:hypothetical protein